MFYSIWHLLHDRHRLNANGANAIEQVNHLFFVISEFVGVEDGDREFWVPFFCIALSS
jgi:hypothetical protein